MVATFNALSFYPYNPFKILTVKRQMDKGEAQNFTAPDKQSYYSRRKHLKEIMRYTVKGRIKNKLNRIEFTGHT